MDHKENLRHAIETLARTADCLRAICILPEDQMRRWLLEYAEVLEGRAITSHEAMNRQTRKEHAEMN